MDTTNSYPTVDEIVACAVEAQGAFATWSETRVDWLLHDIAETVAQHAEELAVATVEETGIGDIDDKTAKNRLVSRRTFASLVGRPGTGLLRVDPQTGLVEYASPVGVILGLVPRTHPVATFVFKVL